MHPGMEMPEVPRKEDRVKVRTRTLGLWIVLGVLSAGAGWSAHAMAPSKRPNRRQVDEIR